MECLKKYSHADADSLLLPAAGWSLVGLLSYVSVSGGLHPSVAMLLSAAAYEVTENARAHSKQLHRW